MSDRITILQQCPPWEYKCEQYQKMKHQEIAQEVHVFWACPHGGFKRTVYVMPRVSGGDPPPADRQTL